MQNSNLSRQLLYSLLVVGAILLPRVSMAQNAFELKAALTYNFAKFTQWPEARLNTSSAWKICFFGNQYHDSFMGLSDKTLGTQSVMAIELSGISQIDQCDVVFVDTNSRELTHRLLVAVDNKAILTVSDITGFAMQGGMIEIVEQDKRLYFKVNMQVVAKSGLTISSQVLKLALEVKR
ncbi:YfiR family protein [Shewanella frigidimarina]|uniref:YfiR family protein n=1 Tax=Shewanella frigidimarina TaxID=56812 RepID=UPI000F4EBF89|nr:YfiR family protein [Shewanella frigidimarina]RPA35886.1 YfiR family protein [Shewanella frigidimarina]